MLETNTRACLQPSLQAAVLGLPDSVSHVPGPAWLLPCSHTPCSGRLSRHSGGLHSLPLFSVSLQEHPLPSLLPTPVSVSACRVRAAAPPQLLHLDPRTGLPLGLCSPALLCTAVCRAWHTVAFPAILTPGRLPSIEEQLLEPEP